MSKKIKAKEYMNWDKVMTNDLTPLEALERIKNAPTIYVGCASDIYTRYSFECKEIEKALKALEIIKKKAIDVQDVMISNTYSEFNQRRSLRGLVGIPKEEYDLLKEVLL